jgi:hypothetical protein
MALFDLSKPCVKAIRSTFGGGWVIPLNEEGEDVLERFFEEPAAPLAPLGNQLGYIVEPADAGELAEYLRESGRAWSVE